MSDDDFPRGPLLTMREAEAGPAFRSARSELAPEKRLVTRLISVGRRELRRRARNAPFSRGRGEGAMKDPSYLLRQERGE
jgi:hypothetical protein